MTILNLSTIDFVFMLKIGILFLIGVYALFVLVVFNNIRGLSKLVLIESAGGTPFIRMMSLIYLGLTIVLFVSALVIL